MDNAYARICWVIAGEKWVTWFAVVLGGEFAASLYYFILSLKNVNYVSIILYLIRETMKEE